MRHLVTLAIATLVLTGCQNYVPQPPDETMVTLQAKYEALTTAEAVNDFEHYISQYEGFDGFESLPQLQERVELAYQDGLIQLEIEEFIEQYFSDSETCLDQSRELEFLYNSHRFTHQLIDGLSASSVEAGISKCMRLVVAYIEQNDNGNPAWVDKHLSKNLKYLMKYDEELAYSLRDQVCSKLDELYQTNCYSKP